MYRVVEAKCAIVHPNKVRLTATNLDAHHNDIAVCYEDLLQIWAHAYVL